MNKTTKRYLLLLHLLAISSFTLPAQERFRKSPPFPDPLPELKLSSLESIPLSNGLNLFLIPRENHPLMAIRLVIFAGESFSPDKLPGLATVTAHLITRETQSLLSSDIEERIDAIGGAFSVDVTFDCAYFTFLFLEDYLDEALSILSKMFLEPSFSERELENVKRTLFYDLVAKARDPDFIAKRNLIRFLFKNHPYEKFAFNEDVIKNISQRDVVSFFKRYFLPNNAFLLIAGNLNAARASRRVSHYFNTWAQADLEKISLFPPQSNKEEKVCFIDLPQIKEPLIFLGNTLFPMTSSDLISLSIFNHILGGTPNSRLFMNLRESKEYAYWAFSELQMTRACGLYIIKTKITPKVIYPAVQEILSELKRMTNEKVSTYEVEQAKSYFLGNFPLKIEKYENFLSQLVELLAFRLGEEYWTSFYENIMLVNADRIFETAQQYSFLTPIIIIVGDKSTLIHYLDEFERIEIYDYKGNWQYTQVKGEKE